MVTLGEGWHNNHHSDMRAAMHGWRWYEIDITYEVLRLLNFFGVVWNLRLPEKAD